MAIVEVIEGEYFKVNDELLEVIESDG